MASPQVILDITDKQELVRIHGVNGNRKTTLARLDPEKKTIYWESQDLRGTFRKSVDAYLANEKIEILTSLLKGQEPDKIPASAPARPKMHLMQGTHTPALIDWLFKYAPIEFQNTYEVELKPLAEGEKPPADPRDRWVRADVIRTDSRPVEETHGGEYISTRFKMKNQIIARARTHLTFDRKEIFRGDKATDQAEPYEDRYTPKMIEQMDRKGEIEIVWRRPSAASALSNF